MIIQLQNKGFLNSVENKLKEYGIKTNAVITQEGVYLISATNTKIDIRTIGFIEGVKDVHAVKESYQLVSSEWKIQNSTIDLGDGIKIGDGDISLMAGPCSIESESQVEGIVHHLVKNKIRIMRGGVFKPRSSPYAFRGMGIEGLKMFSGICRKNNIRIITEVMQVSQIAEMIDYVDIFQVGARNSQNYNLLDALGEAGKPVLLKRGISGSMDELLHSAEYIFSGGNEKIILCERGIRTFENAYRNTFDINAIAMLKAKSHLPVIADPSHGIGIRAFVPKIALAALSAGADGIIYEVHPKPEEALSDGQQTLNFEESEKMVEKLRMMKELV